MGKCPPTYIKIRICSNCGKQESIRKDSKSIICKSCASSRAGIKGNLTKKINAEARKHPCKICDKKTNNHKFCSKKCLTEYQKLNRITRCCKTCSKHFSISPSIISRKTNSSANFCNRNCYDLWLCKTEKTTGRGSRWKSIRNTAIKKAPFCAYCGTMKNKLDVHHIVPFRLTFDNSQNNLIPLCKKCHKMVETVTHDVEGDEYSYETMKIVMRSILKERQLSTLMIIKKIIGEFNA